MQSIWRQEKRHHIDVNGNPLKRNSTKLVDKDNPMAIRKGKYMIYPEQMNKKQLKIFKNKQNEGK